MPDSKVGNSERTSNRWPRLPPFEAGRARGFGTVILFSWCPVRRATREGRARATLPRRLQKLQTNQLHGVNAWGGSRQGGTPFHTPSGDDHKIRRVPENLALQRPLCRRLRTVCGSNRKPILPKIHYQIAIKQIALGLPSGFPPTTTSKSVHSPWMPTLLVALMAKSAAVPQSQPPQARQNMPARRVRIKTWYQHGEPKATQRVTTAAAPISGCNYPGFDCGSPWLSFGLDSV